MILHIKSTDPNLYQLENSPPSWRKDWSIEHLDTLLLYVINGKPVGRLGIYLNPYFQDKNIAFLGAFEVIEDYKISEALLSTAISYLRGKGTEQIIGPIDGSTWNNYRFRETNSKAPFFMEPTQAKWYPEYWKKFGFSTYQQYCSNRMELAEVDTSFLKINESDLKERGITLRNFKPDQAEQELELLADFNQQAFQKSYLFSPFSRKKFITKYQPLTSYFDPDLIFFAEDKDGLAGLVFTIPNHLDQSGKSAIIKTLARKPGKDYAGLGRYLVHYIIQKTKEKGFKYLIHALMHVENASLNLSKRLKAKVYSEYSLLEYKFV